MVVVAALLGAPGASAELRIASPSQDQFFTSAPVRVEVSAPRKASAIRVRLDGQVVTRAFERVRPGLWRARLGARRLDVGPNHIVVSATVGKRSLYDGTRFFLGRRAPAFLALAVPPRRAGPLVGRVDVKGRPETLRATLNGDRLRWPRQLWDTSRVSLPLGADDGLGFGANKLRVFAAKPNGGFDVERRTIRVPRTRPLAGAGRDRRTTAGARVRLDGRSSRAALGADARLSYRWQVVREPRGSKGNLRRAGSARPLLVADRPGVYRVQLIVTETGRSAAGARVSRSASDVTTVSSEPNVKPVGMPIETIDYNGENTEETADTGIRLGSKVYWLGMPKGNSVQALILERDTLEVLYAASYPGTKANAETLKSQVKKYGANALVVISNPDLFANSEVNSLFATIAESLGLNKKQGESLKLGRAGWSVIGVPGSKNAFFGAGESWDLQGAGNVRGNLSGYLAKGGVSSYGFNFVPAGRVVFETAAPVELAGRNTIRIGGAEYLSSPFADCATGGFQVEVVIAETLVPVSGETFATNGCGAAAGEAGEKAMTAYLEAVTLVGGQTEGPKLVFVQSIGSPFGPASASRAALATALERLGATGSVFGEATESYALVGGLGIEDLPLTEASQSLTGQAASLAGVLEPNRNNSHVPVLSSPGGAEPYQLSAIAYQAPRAWPLSQTAEQKAALKYAAEFLHLERSTSQNACYLPEQQPDVRAQYCNLDARNEWKSMAGELRNAPFRSGHGFKSTAWKALRTQLAGEFEDVQKTWSLVTTLQSAFGPSSTSALVNLKKIALEIEEATAPPAKSEVAGWWLELTANLLSIASYYSFDVPKEVVQKTTGTLSGALFITAQLIFGPQGAPAAETFKIETADFAHRLSETYLDASVGLDRVGEIVVTDYGKLTAAKEAGLFGINGEVVEKLAGVLGPGSRGWSYQKLLPAAYEAVSLEGGPVYNNPLPETAGEYNCTYYAGQKGAEGEYKPFAKAPKLAQLRTKSPAGALGVLVIAGEPLPGSSAKEEPRMATKKLLEPVFKAETEGGLGLHAPWFWRSAFDYPSKQSSTVNCG